MKTILILLVGGLPLGMQNASAFEAHKFPLMQALNNAPASALLDEFSSKTSNASFQFSEGWLTGVVKFRTGSKKTTRSTATRTRPRAASRYRNAPTSRQVASRRTAASIINRRAEQRRSLPSASQRVRTAWVKWKARIAISPRLSPGASVKRGQGRNLTFRTPGQPNPNRAGSRRSSVSSISSATLSRVGTSTALRALNSQQNAGQASPVISVPAPTPSRPSSPRLTRRTTPTGVLASLSQPNSQSVARATRQISVPAPAPVQQSGASNVLSFTRFSGSKQSKPK